MPIKKYSVAIGAFDHFTRDSSQQGTYGKYYHGHIYLQTASGIAECAVDVSTPEGMPVAYLQRKIDPAAFKSMAKLSSGIHALASNATSGALDYVRKKALKASDPASWTLAQADATLDELEALLKSSKQVWVFGAAYTTGLGIHDVHLNQGDPAGTQWYAANGVWQDGGVIVQSGKKLRAFLTKFTNQSLDTDKNGNPKP